MTIGLGLGFHARGGPPPAPPVFLPTNLSNLLVWYDASDTSTIISSLGAVSALADKSGGGYTATQATGAKQPVTGTRTVNGRNVLDFDGSNDTLSMPSGLNSLTTGNNTIFIVFAADAGAGFPFCFQASGGRRTGFLLHATNGIAYYERNITSYIPYTWNTSPHVAAVSLNGTAITGYFEGASVSGTCTETSWVTTGRLIAGFNDVDNYFNGTIGEIIAYRRALSDAEKNDVGNYLADKWGCAWTNL